MSRPSPDRPKLGRKAIRKYLAYFNERFPPAGAALYAGTLYFVAYFFPSTWDPATPVSAHSLLGFATVFLVLLHLRIFDEHKDFERDRIAHPKRLLSRGEITLAELRKLLPVVIAAEAGMSLLLGVEQLILWVAVFVWSLLMFVEFFVPEFLRRHLGWYLISHQLIVPLIGLYAIGQRTSLLQLTGDCALLVILILAGMMCLTITYEFSRKTWSSDREHDLADSYTKEWGRVVTVAVTLATAALGGGILIYLFEVAEVSRVFTAAVAGLGLVLIVMELTFLRRPNARNSKILEAVGILFMMGSFAIGAVGFHLV